MLNNVISYSVYTSSKANVTIRSAGDYWGGSSWDRSSNVLAITSSGHGLSSDDFVMIRNANEDYLYARVTSSDADHFTVGCNNTGTTSGTDAAYITALSASIIEDGTSGLSSITLGAPTAASSSVQLLGMNVVVHDSTAGQLNDLFLNIPQSLKNGGSESDGTSTILVPLVQGYYVDSTNTSQFSTVPKITYASGFNQIEFDSSGQARKIFLKILF